MKLLFLRGKVPQDRPKKEIMWNNLHENPDLWENIACNLAETVEILYWGGDRIARYDRTKWAKWVKSFEKYRPDFEPDAIFARGGFEEYHPILKAFPSAVKIYYGAGARYLPLRGFYDYDITLQDSPYRFAKASQAYPEVNHVLWVKPAVDQFFFPQNVEKQYDVAFVANGGQARIKRISWVYKTAPEDLSILHLGLKSSYKPPNHIKTKRVIKEGMARQLSKCHVGIIPYKDTDSAPRALPEMLACGLPVVVMDSCHVNHKTFYDGKNSFGRIVTKDKFWETVRLMVNWVKEDHYETPSTVVSEFYQNNVSMRVCCGKLRELIRLARENRK
jgi:glycosyltransferase involved in cell wall biosynthesis